MRTEIRNNGLFDYTVLIADEGMWLRRISTKENFGPEIALGKSYYINNEKLDTPHDDIISDFEEYHIPEEEITEEETTET